MGLFSFLAAAALPLIGGLIGKAVEKVKEYFGSGSQAEERRERDAASVVQAAKSMSKAAADSKSASRAGQTGSYDANTASVEQTVNVERVLSDFDRDLRPQAERLEQESKNYVQNYFNDLIKAMESVLGNCAATRNMKNQQGPVVREVTGKLTSVLARRVSLTDWECKSILQMKAGSEKERRMKAFGQEVLQEGLNNLCDSLEEALNGVCASIEEEMSALAETQKRDLENLIAQLKAVTEKRTRDSGSTEEAMLSPAEKLKACELMSELLEGQEAA